MTMLRISKPDSRSASPVSIQLVPTHPHVAAFGYRVVGRGGAFVCPGLSVGFMSWSLLTPPTILPNNT